MVRSSERKLGIVMLSSAMKVCTTAVHLAHSSVGHHTQACPRSTHSNARPTLLEYPPRLSTLRLKTVTGRCTAVRTAAMHQPGNKHPCRVSSCHLSRLRINRRRMCQQFRISNAGRSLRTSTALHLCSELSKSSQCRGTLQLLASDLAAMVTTATQHCRSNMAQVDRLYQVAHRTLLSLTSSLLLVTVNAVHQLWQDWVLVRAYYDGGHSATWRSVESHTPRLRTICRAACHKCVYRPTVLVCVRAAQHPSQQLFTSALRCMMYKVNSSSAYVSQALCFTRNYARSNLSTVPTEHGEYSVYLPQNALASCRAGLSIISLRHAYLNFTLHRARVWVMTLPSNVTAGGVIFRAAFKTCCL